MSAVADFAVINGGNVALIIPNTQDAKDWVDENVSEDRTCFGEGFGVEHRYIDQLIAGIEKSGLSVSMG